MGGRGWQWGRGKGGEVRVHVCKRERGQAREKQVYDSAGGTQISPQISLAGAGAEAQCLGSCKEVHSSSCDCLPTG